MYDFTETVEALQATFDHEIPITGHIGIRVASYDGKSLVLGASLEPNINHKATAFAGSLNSLVTLAGWGLIWLLLREWNISATTVIQDSACNYKRPVTRDFTATCFKPDDAELAYFARMLREKGRARLELQAEMRENDLIAVSFSGRYVVHVH
jgi:thioesterase domain-containing protein